VNQNYLSTTGTQYHVQVEDRGPVLDPVTESHVRRVNLIIYANYGEANARIIYGHDYDWDDVRTIEYNRLMDERVKELTAAAREIIEEKEARQIGRHQEPHPALLPHQGRGGEEGVRGRERPVPLLFSRAWPSSSGSVTTARCRYGWRSSCRPRVRPRSRRTSRRSWIPARCPRRFSIRWIPRYASESSRSSGFITDIDSGVTELRSRGAADDILVQTCRKLIARAREILAGKEPSEITIRRLDTMRQTLLTTWKQIQSRLKSH